MTYCTNPNCPAPQNAATNPTCYTCGSSLRLNDRYSALQLLGQSASVRTYSAIDTQHRNTKCVIKQFLLQAVLTQEAIALFHQEVQSLKALGEHPQIPSFIDAFEQANQLYLIQEWIEGHNLAAVLQQQGSFSESQIWQLLTELLPLLQFIHQRQVHQDIKPENIIQTPEHLSLVDFGLAIGVAQAETLIGSPEYAAPEQTQGKAVYASDLYSLGVTCIHLLTEVSPFDLYDSFNDRWIWRSYLARPVSERLARVLDKLIQNTLNLRFQTADQAIQESGIRKTARKLKQASKSQAPLSALLAPGAVNAIALHHAEPILASADDKTLCLWDIATRQRLVTLVNKGTRSLIFTLDGARLISAGDDKKIRLWDWRSGEVITTFTGHTGSVRSLALSPNGQMLASASWDKTIRLWDWRSGELTQVLKHGLQVTAAAFSPDGQWLASASCDRTVRLWSLAKLKPDQPTLLSGHAWAVLTVAFSPDSQIVATGSEDNTVKLWEVQTGRLLQTLTGHSWAIATLSFSPDGRTLLSGSWDKTIKLWDTASGTLQTTLEGHTDSVRAIAISPFTSTIGYELFSGGRDKLIYRWHQP
ncbi:MAG: serine/threonine protein kinase [Drouetiella hepatica Uher 2000/2452]|jgi:serine/threonine protein kinase|uniref:Serine/threonine protein kinase n=1 Tax=Drouetiella hepatica Uher 2000/2452 TaxID=904376 RepID=A0A951QG55_9CYAN|nr:serine/threonine protein kinase [Drouetiella hepatica Uher 2000/2452]